MPGLIQGLMDTLLVWGTRSSDRSKMEAADVTEGALHSLEQGNVAGLRNPSSSTNSYAIRYEDWNLDVVDLSVDSTTIGGGVPVRLGAIYVNTVLSAHECLVKDGTTTKFRLPASSAAGREFPLCKGRFETSLVIDPNDAATGEIVVLWRPL